MTASTKVGATVVLVAAAVLAGYGIWESGMLDNWPYALGALLAVRANRV